MKFTPFQLGVLAIGTFGSIVLLSILSKAQSDASFAENFKATFSPERLASIRTTRVAEEIMEPVSHPSGLSIVEQGEDNGDDPEA